MSDHSECLFEQYWLHARHQELQRLTFTSIYSAIIAGSFAFIGSEHADLSSRAFLSLAILILSFFGFFLMHSWRIPFVVYSRLAESIMIERFGLERYKRFGEYGKLSSASLVFHAFYILMASLCFSIFVISFTNAYPNFNPLNLTLDRNLFALIGSLSVFLVMCFIYVAVFGSAERKMRSQIKEKFSRERI